MSAPHGVSPLNSPARGRSTRDRPAKAPLSVDVVVDAALTILKSEGLNAVTMRRVAAALDTGPASLYVYVAGSDGLLQAMLDRVISTIELKTPNRARWRVQLHSLLARLHEALVTHPGIAAMTLANPPTTEGVLRLAENLLAILLAGGIDPQDAAWACDIFVLLTMAAASEDDVRRPSGGRVDEESRRELVYDAIIGLPGDRFPVLIAHATQMVSGDAQQRFRFAIDVVVDGMLARAGTRSSAPPRTKTRRRA